MVLLIHLTNYYTSIIEEVMVLFTAVMDFLIRLNNQDNSHFLKCISVLLWDVIELFILASICLHTLRVKLELFLCPYGVCI